MKASDLIDTKLDFIVAQFDNRTALQISLTKLKKIFAQHNLTVDSPYPVITIYKMKPLDLMVIKDELKNRFLAHYSDLNIVQIDIAPQSFIDIDGEVFERVEIGSNVLKRNRGNFIAWFSGNKRIFFSYEIEASLPAFKTTKMVEGGTIIGTANSVQTNIKFESLSDRPIRSDELEKVSAKGRISQGDIITLNRTTKIPDLFRGANVRVELIESGVRLSFFATAQKNAQIGEVVNVKDTNGKVHRVRLISKDLARIE